MEPLEGSTRIDKALTFANEQIIKKKAASRKDILDVVVLVSDGVSDPSMKSFNLCGTERVIASGVISIFSQ